MDTSDEVPEEDLSPIWYPGCDVYYDLSGGDEEELVSLSAQELEGYRAPANRLLEQSPDKTTS